MRWLNKVNHLVNDHVFEKVFEPKGRVVMTTWHSKESLSEALWFFANCVEPDDGFEADCMDWIALCFSNDSWGKQIRSALIKRP